MLAFYITEQIEEEKRLYKIKNNEKRTDVFYVKERKEKVNQLVFSNQ